MSDAIILKKIQELPPNIRKAVETFDWSTEVLHIAQDNQIHIDDIETFRNETLLVIVGLTAATDYEKKLVAHMGITHEVAENLVADANQHIFRISTIFQSFFEIGFSSTQTLFHDRIRVL